VFRRKESRRSCAVYVEGQLSDLPRKTAEPIARRASVPPRTLQAFLTLHDWQADGLEEQLTRRVRRRHAHPEAVFVVDETSDDKQGDKTPGVQRQYCGCLGKVENSIVTVHLAYATPTLHALLAGDLYLPQSWADDRPRCRAAGIPDEVGFRTKPRIALDLLDAAQARGVAAEWITFDEGYGNSPGFLAEVAARKLNYVAEVPKSFVGWARAPKIVMPRGRGRPPQPRLSARTPPAQTVEELARRHPALRGQPWVPYRIKDGEKGPLVWQAKTCRFWMKGADGRPGAERRLLVLQNPLTGETKYFVSNADGASVEQLLRVAFTRWTVERCFEDGKQEVGFLHFEGRTWTGLRRHLALAALSHLFLQEVRQDEAKKKSGSHRGAGPAGGVGTAAALGLAAPHHAAAGGTAGRAPRRRAGRQRPRAARPLVEG
jgi:SRSO17 transposase